ncbi:hypothetical protein RJ640_028802 [Escallonia rubra]|uniref:Uncharacterized protein n=1 Tax=Escallonia rubra TaxID=112253 RepID=A0AA88R0N4_9ASTE|nr:hypothetical protein RJ640_028802 [Escallonia rubra]
MELRICKMRRASSLNHNRLVSSVKRALKGIRVEVNHREHVRRYKICGLSTQPISQLTFHVDDTGASTSVVQYFRQKYNIVLQYSFLPALQAGTDAKPVYLPMEICRIVEGQRYSKKLNDKQVTALLKATCQRPHEREASIMGMVAGNNYNNDELVNKEFGIQMRTELTTIDARVLPPPLLKYHDTGREKQVVPSVGQWNMINKVINRSPLLPISSADPRDIGTALFNIHTQSTAKLSSMGQSGERLQLLIIILPDFSSRSYGTIKRVCETELGIISQCCQPKHVARNSKQYLENVALKINVKAGGRNTVLLHAVERKIPILTADPIIIFGADVTHPPPGEDSSPSIAAVVASMDWPEVTKYRGLVSAQSHRQEIIENLYSKFQDEKGMIHHGGMIRDHLVAFRKATSRKPLRIIFYRDGVSEGQFNQVLLHEIDDIRRACVSLEENYLPPITFVVVQKRHHTRLFPMHHGDKNSTDRSGNILPGTVVETKICHPNEFDFYLCSHAGIQGTSRPTHYHVLYDENKFTADAMQMLTNSLCYTYSLPLSSLKYMSCWTILTILFVPPAYYAHLAAFRARYYVEGDASETESATGGRATRDRNVEVRPLPVIKDNVKDVMFYC